MNLNVYAPEAEIILRTARPRLLPHQDERISVLIKQTDLDWDRLVALAVRHRTVPQLYGHLRRICLADIPPAPLQELRSASLRFTERSLRQASDLLRIVRLLADAGIETIAYKGPVMAALAYSGQVRSCNDLDLLMRREDRDRAVKLLLSHGFRQYHSLSEAAQQARVKYGHEEILCADGDRLYLEIHYEIAPIRYNLGLATDDLFARSISQPFSGTSIATLSHEDLLLYLCWHGCKHFWQPVRQIVDIVEFVAAVPNMDWTALGLRSRRLDLHGAVTVALILCRDVLGTDLPPEAMAQFTETRAARAASAFFRRGLFADRPPTVPLRRLEEIRTQVTLRSGLSNKIATAAALAFTPSERDVEGAAVNPRLSRPIRLLRKYLTRGASS